MIALFGLSSGHKLRGHKLRGHKLCGHKLCGHKLRSEIHILQPILLHTLLQKYLALVARLGAKEFIRMNLLTIPRNSHNVHIRPTQLTNIPQLLNHIFLGMNTMIRVA